MIGRNWRWFLMSMALTSACVATVAAQDRPNVVILFTDDQGTLDANCYGSADQPHQLAGTLLQRAHVHEQQTGLEHAANLFFESLETALEHGASPQELAACVSSTQRVADQLGSPWRERFQRL